MDGNGRWARSRGLPRTVGHQRGAEAVRRVVVGAAELGISYLTLFGFSSENWKRPLSEIDDLMALLRLYIRSEIDGLDRNGVRIRVIGDRQKLAPDIVQLIEQAEARTRGNRRLNLTVALSYGGRAEITQAAARIAEDVQAGKLQSADVNEALFSRYLLTAELPDPDFIIRTSGEKRISNFLLWQSAYTELIFLERLWPDFTKDDLSAAIQEYQQRDRRYGGTA
ncbi:MAG TPA: isoprenyl transferase [Dongiaceae bacterium]|jgi:undecaprenyl diphosphate synthase